MTLKQAREAARRWIIDEASRFPGFRGAYTAGSSNWLPDDAEFTSASDLDIMVVLADGRQAGRRRKFIYRDALLEVSHLAHSQLQSLDQVLSDYHLAPSLSTTKVLVDPLGHLTPLVAAVSRGYGKRTWVRRRCANARDKVLGHLRSISEQAFLHDQVTACLFAAGITTHILLVAGLENPTVRTRYVTVRRLLAGYGHAEFHETLLDLLGSARLTQERVSQHLGTLAEIFDTAKRVIKTPFPFASDISDCARPIVIDGSADLISRSLHREAMFWIAVTHSRCQKVLTEDEPEALTQSFRESYRQMLNDLGIASSAEIRRGCEEIDRSLPEVSNLADRIIAANPKVEDD